MKVRCEGCRRILENVRLREKTLAGLHVERVRMCTPCARKHGYADVTFDRGFPRTIGAVPP